MSLSKLLASAAIATVLVVPAAVYGATKPAPTMNSIVAQATMTPEKTADSADPTDAKVQEIPHPAQPQADPTGAPSAAMSTTVTNGPIPDNAANRAKYGQPMSHAGRASKAAGN